MNVLNKIEWTPDDEAQLAALIDRKETYEANKRRALERLVENFFYNGIGFDDVIEDMIKRADEYTAALAPFTAPQG